MNSRFTLFAVILVIVGAIAGGFFGRLPARTSAESGVSKERLLADYKEALAVIDEGYGGIVDHEKVSDSSMQAMLWTLDPHSSFFRVKSFGNSMRTSRRNFTASAFQYCSTAMVFTCNP